MSDRARGVLAWTLYALTLLISLAALTLLIANQGFAAVWVGENDIGSLLGFQFAFGAVGALIISRQPRNVIGWLLITPAVMIAFLNAINVYLDAFYSNVTYIAHPPLALWLALSFETSSWVALIFPLLLIGQYFPDGRPVSPRWRWLGFLTLVWGASFVIGVLLISKGISSDDRWTWSNPYGIVDPVTANVWINAVWSPGLLVLVSLSLTTLFLRFRRARADGRNRLKSMLYVCALFCANYLVGSFIDAATGNPLDWIINFIFFLTVLAFPVAIGLAILRHKLFDIDIIIRRTLVFTGLVFSLGVTYALSVIGLQALFVRLTGAENTLAVVASTLAIAALFQPLRRRLQAVIERRFFRRAYDASQVLESFARRAQVNAELETVSRDLLDTVQDTFEPEHVRLWLRHRPASVSP